MNSTTPQPLSIFVQRASWIISDYRGGEAQICFNILGGLARRGHKVVVFSEKGGDFWKEPPVTLKVISARTQPRVSDTWRGFRYALEANKIFRQYGVGSFDLVWRMYPYGAGCPLRPGAAPIPYVLGPLSMGARKLPSFGLKHLPAMAARANFRRIVRRASAVFVNTRGHKERLAYQYPGLNIHSIPVIVDPPVALVPRKRQSPKKAKPIRLLYVGHMSPYKSPEVMILVGEMLIQRGFKVELTFVGNGKCANTITDMAAQRGLHSVKLVGQVPNHEVYEYMRRAHFLCLFSIGESYGRVLAEAMAVGTPCITHRSGGPADLVAETDAGWTVERVEAELYAEVIERAVRMPELWCDRSSNALNVSHQWRSEVVLDRFEAALYEIVSC